MKNQSKNKIMGCVDLMHGLYLAPDELRTCCKRFFVNGEMKGDVVLQKIKPNDPPTIESILSSKKRLIEDINAGKETPCTGCPWLVETEYDNQDELKIKHLSFEYHSICNLKCSYCSDIYYGGKKPAYNIMDLYNVFKSKGVLSECNSVVWGGGEPTADKSFTKLLNKVTDDLNPNHQKVFSNAVIYNKKLSEFLSAGKASLSTSIDAGSPKTFEKVRGYNHLHRVLSNIKRYLNEGAKDITIKYIFTDQNSELIESQLFCKLISKYEILDCSFQISSDFKHDILTKNTAISSIYMYLKLRENTKYVFFDDHLKPKINKFALSFPDIINNNFGSEIANPEKFAKVIIWGAGQYSLRMLHTSMFFTKVIVEHFVDNNREKIGKHFMGKIIRAPKDVLLSELPIVIGASDGYSDIYTDLIKIGVKDDRIIQKIIL